MEKLIIFIYLENFEDWGVDKLLDDLQFVLGMLLEQVLINAPEV